MSHENYLYLRSIDVLDINYRYVLQMYQTINIDVKLSILRIHRYSVGISDFMFFFLLLQGFI